MRRSRVGAGGLAVRLAAGMSALGCLGLVGDVGAASRPHERPADADVLETYANLPLAFEPNVGQGPESVGYMARGRGYSLSLAPTRALLAVSSSRPDVAPAVVGAELVGANPSAAAAPGDPLAGRVNYLPADPAARRTDVPTYGRVTYREVYQGVDVVYYGKQGQLEYDFVVRPQADPSPLRVSFSGIDSLEIDGRGDVNMRVGAGTLVQRAPVAYQDTPGGRRPVEASYVRGGATDVGLRLGDYDRSRALVIDPILAYSTYLGGNGTDTSTAIEVDGAGSAYIAATTVSSDFPITPGAVQPLKRGTDMVVTKLSPGGDALVYSTYLGGSGEDYGGAIAVDAGGHAYVTGRTGSDDFPVVNAAQPARAGEYDAVAVKLNPTGSAFVYSTYLGGSEVEHAYRIEVDGAGSAYVTGLTYSPDFPTVKALQSLYAGSGDTFLTRLSPSGAAFVSSTFLGGSGTDEPYGMGLDAAGNVMIGGETDSADFPTRNAFQPARRGHEDGYVTKIDATGSTILYSTYLGGSGETIVYGLAGDPAGNAHVIGMTSSPDFPLVRPLQTTPGQVFVAKFDAAGGVVFSTYLGDGVAGTGIAVAPSGRIWVTGDTASTAFPTVAPIQAANAGNRDAFISALAPDGSALVFSTYLGGSSTDFGHGIAVDRLGAAYVVGHTLSTDFPTRNAFDTTFTPSPTPFPPTGYDLFVAKIELGPPAAGGATWHSNGSLARSGPAGTGVSVYGIAAFQNVPYLLVLTRGQSCSDVVAVLNPTTRFANTSGFIPTTRATIPAGTPAGTYQICFRDTGGATATAAATFTVG